MKTILIKKALISLNLIFITAFSFATNGLKKVIVEKYYVANTDDSDNSIGTLPEGSVTYRVFLEMNPGYQFMMAYGDRNHKLFFETTTTFFNNEDRGSTSPTYTKAQAKNNTVMLDSWVSAGAACVGNFGIPKNEDDGVATVVNADVILQNTDTSAGIPLTTQDGLIAGSPGIIGLVGLDPSIKVFDATSQAGNRFEATNGSWYCLAGARGPKVDSTKVLIAQITTDGQLTFELNVQLRYFKDGNPVAELYVAREAMVTNGIQEIMEPSLYFSSKGVPISIKNILAASNKNEISVFPNPSNGVFKLNIKPANNNSEINYSIYNVLGDVILKKKIDHVSGNYTESLNISSYAKGIYYMVVSTNGVKSAQKIVKN
jgi:hypothetical protein